MSASGGRRTLNDTSALRDRPIRGGETTNPDVSGFRAARGVRPGQYDVTVNEAGTAELREVPGPCVGSECLRGAVAHLSGARRR